MPVPLVFIGIAALTGATGIGATVKAGFDHTHAKKINLNSEERIALAATHLEELRGQCGDALQSLGEAKLYVLSQSIMRFLDAFTQIKNVDFQETEGLQELEKLHIDQGTFEEIGELKHFAISLVQGSATGITAGALMALGAYSAAAAFASASTGTAIATLSGAAATNATLAFFGGGSLAAGGLGIAGGTAVLGGLVAGPAIMIMGLITGANAGKGLEEAKKHAAEADVLCEQYESGARQCIAIRRRAYMFHNLLVRLDAYFMPLLYALEDVIKTEGTDFSQYSPESKKTVALSVSSAMSLKSVLDTPILCKDGSLAQEADAVLKQLSE